MLQKQPTSQQVVAQAQPTSHAVALFLDPVVSLFPHRVFVFDASSSARFRCFFHFQGGLLFSGSKSLILMVFKTEVCRIDCANSGGVLGNSDWFLDEFWGEKITNLFFGGRSKNAKWQFVRALPLPFKGCIV